MELKDMVLNFLSGVLVAVVVPFVVHSTMSRVCKKLDALSRQREHDTWRRDKEHKAMAECVKAMARMQLVEAHDRYKKQGWMPDCDKRSFNALYESYEKMGANGIIENYHSECMQLPNIKGS